jgi:ATP-dependent exoDNAse (exonuclease V) alpha subunit
MQEAGIKAGDIFTVEAVNKQAKTVTFGGHTYQTSELSMAADTGKVQGKTYARNDQVVLNFTPKKSKELGIIKGEAATITAIDDQQITLKTVSGKELVIDHKQAKDLDHGYVMTSHKSQGQTQKRAMINLSSKSANLSNQQTLYVAMSRATDDVQVFTDNRAALEEQIQARTGEKTIAEEVTIKQPEVEQKQESIKHQEAEQEKPELVQTQQPTIKRSRGPRM